MKPRVALLISGRGSNMTALIAAARAADYPATIALVLADRPEAAGLSHAQEAGIETLLLARAGFASRAAFEESLTRHLEAHAIDLIALAGFMRVLSPPFVAHWRDRLINIHPSLLPAYPGLDTHARALADGVLIAGCTVHFVRAEVDRGPIIAQAAVPVMRGDDAQSLARRVLAAEHRLYPHALALVASGALLVQNETIVWRQAWQEGEAPPLFAPPLD